MVVTFIPQDCARNGFGARDPRRPSLFGLDEPLHLGGVAKADVAESRFRPACSPTPAGRPPHHEPHSRDKHEHGHGLHIQQYPRDESGCHHQPVRWPGRDPQRTDGQCPTTAAPQARSRELMPGGAPLRGAASYEAEG